MNPAEINQKATEILAIEDTDEREKAIQAINEKDREAVLDAMAEISAKADEAAEAKADGTVTELIITQEDLDADPELAKKGFKVGDEVPEEETNTTRENFQEDVSTLIELTPENRELFFEQYEGEDKEDLVNAVADGLKELEGTKGKEREEKKKGWFAKLADSLTGNQDDKSDKDNDDNNTDNDTNEDKPTDSEDEEVDGKNQEAKELIGQAQGMQADGNHDNALKNLEKAVEVSVGDKMKEVAEANLEACKKAKKDYEAQSEKAAKAGRKAKKITGEDIRNDCNAIVVKLDQIAKQEAEAGRNGLRYMRAKKQILRLIRTALK